MPSSRCRRPATSGRSGRCPPAVAFDRQAFGESAEILEKDGLNMVEVPMTAAVMWPPKTLAYDLITTVRHVQEADPILAEHVANTTAVLTDRGMKVTRSKHGSTRPNVAAVAMVRAIAMAMLEPPPPPAPRHRELPVTAPEVGSPTWWLDRLGAA
jgi:phage terminase large subunit-like protein